ncbi:MAG: hypothetical protein MJY52_00690, partial [Bacteroidaceae bacterium]|nr:hypothetical protein [Bacteroidaceae bacterium]
MHIRISNNVHSYFHFWLHTSAIAVAHITNCGYLHLQLQWLTSTFTVADIINYGRLKGWGKTLLFLQFLLIYPCFVA